MPYRNKARLFIIIILLTLIVGAVLYLGMRFNIIPMPTYRGADFGIERVVSPVDFNSNGVDDYLDIMRGARKDAENHPRYDGSYVSGGYPSDDVGVCTDVVWRGFRNAGYSLRDMVDKDIESAPNDYPAVKSRDKNIDFRRVRNLRVFFDKYAISLTLDIDDIEEWQPGDIVIFGDNKHIGIVSDKRNSKGQTYIIHNGGQPNREEDYLKRGVVTGHYRFDASLVPEEILVAWGELD
jgi:uncharacterized protein YijF (DUF1287 family)